MMKQKLLLATITFAAINMGGCLSLLVPEPADPNRIYRLSDDLKNTETAAVGQNEIAFTVRIDRPNTPKALQGYDLLVVKESNELAIIDKAEWADTLPTMIQRAFLSEMNKRSQLVGIFPTSGARSKYRAHITVRHFEAKFDRGEEEAPLVIVDYLVTLSDAGSRDLIGTQSFHVESRANSNHVSDIVQSKSNANRQNLENISDWLVLTLSSHEA